MKAPHRRHCHYYHRPRKQPRCPLPTAGRGWDVAWAGCLRKLVLHPSQTWAPLADQMSRTMPQMTHTHLLPPSGRFLPWFHARLSPDRNGWLWWCRPSKPDVHRRPACPVTRVLGTHTPGCTLRTAGTFLISQTSARLGRVPSEQVWRGEATARSAQAACLARSVGVEAGQGAVILTCYIPLFCVAQLMCPLHGRAGLPSLRLGDIGRSVSDAHGILPTGPSKHTPNKNHCVEALCLSLLRLAPCHHGLERPRAA